MWETAKIGDFGRVVTGKTPASSNPEYFGDSYPFITPTDMTGGRRVVTERRVSEEGARKHESQMLPRNSVCFVCIASIGKLCMTSEVSLTNQQINSIIVNEKRHDPFFVYYLLSIYGEKVKAQAGGVATPIVSKSVFEQIEAVAPPLPVQHRIASLLACYDDLIENNEQRVRVLEGIAKNLYREWFVDFRFPGHKNMKLAESPLGKIPQGWSVGELADLAAVNNRSIGKGHEPAEILYIDIASVAPGIVVQKQRMAFADAPSRARRLVRHGDVIWSTVRPNRRSFALLLSPEPDLVVSTGFAVISPTKVPFSYVYFALTTDEFVGYLTNHATGAAYPAVTGRDFEAAKLLVPASEHLTEFHSIVCPMLELRHQLVERNRVLRQTRDLLLPRLISGELDVSELDIKVPEEVGP